jgi:hypothetical protein
VTLKAELAQSGCSDACAVAATIAKAATIAATDRL